ncbi:MAG: carbamoyltransferase HypF [Candidatus Lokiarchaeota archaeon]|nr:carbamoyltransferase HypF [Candidatus Lokiarchaeota archaeon]
MGLYRINIQGIVQGVGFRPFLFNLAERFGLTGSIINKGNIGVELLVFATNSTLISEFMYALQTEKPEISYIEEVKSYLLQEDDLKDLNIKDLHQSLIIKPSLSGVGPSVTSPPDIAICSDCIKDMTNPNNERFFRYPFTACAICGPRYSTIKELPYDRERTTMDEFPYCSSEDSCLSDYRSPQNRRFHAQTFSCKKCGPNYFFLYNPKYISKPSQNESCSSEISQILKDRNKISLESTKSIQIAAKYILSGKILAVMGIGGVHIVGDARNPKVIETIRTRKRKRKTKPFAVMVPNLDSANQYVEYTQKEKSELLSYRRPIVLLPKKPGSLNDSISPGLHNIGIMLPYAGIHHLLFQQIGKVPLIFTSGNFSDLPMAISPDTVVAQLSHLADGFLLHNREIYQRVDDSVIRVQNSYTKLLRRSRGYVPEYLPLPFNPDITGGIAVGAELNSTGLVSRGHRLFPTQHIGNVNNLETYEFLKKSILHMKSLLKLENSQLDYIAMDLHPRFQSTRLAHNFQEEMGIPLSFNVQHHFAHAASLLVDNKIDRNIPAVVATLDGVGYGLDGKVWGGEIIYGSYATMERTYHLSYIPMVGGDLCVTYPARMVVGFLLQLFGLEKAKEYADKLKIADKLTHRIQELDSILTSYKLGRNVAYSSSCGRLLDSVSNILGVCDRKYYRGEPAMRLEGSSYTGNPSKYDFSSEIIAHLDNNSESHVIPSELLIKKLITIASNHSFSPNNLPDIAASILNSIGKIFAYGCFRTAVNKSAKYIGLSGGVAYNDQIYDAFYNHLRELEQKNQYAVHLLHHNNVPPGDAGISVGQAAIAISKIS